MKAKDLAEKYAPTESWEHLVSIVSDLVDETTALIRQRKIKTRQALVAVLREQNQKWLKVMEIQKTEDFLEHLYYAAMIDALGDDVLAFTPEKYHAAILKGLNHVD